MGTFLISYGDEGYDHERYAAQVLSDGTLTSTYSNDTEARMIGRVVACGCGWRGTTGYPTTTGPFDASAHDLALEEWEHQHARPTLQRARIRKGDQLRTVLVGLAEVHRAAAGYELSRAQQRDLLTRTQDRLAPASELIRQLHAPLDAP